jgi:hypothetical protein
MAAASRNQVAYWDLFYGLVVRFNYMEIYQEHDQRSVRRINAALAITSSSSIGAWAIWHSIAWLWAAIIAGSQVLQAVSAFLPYKQREKTLRTMLPEMHKLLLDCEDDYNRVSGGLLTDAEIHAKTMEYKRSLSKLADEFYDCGLPQRDAYQKLAEAQTNRYVASYVQ